MSLIIALFETLVVFCASHPTQCIFFSLLSFIIFEEDILQNFVHFFFIKNHRSVTDTHSLLPTKRLNDLNDLRGGYIKHDDGERNDDE